MLDGTTARPFFPRRANGAIIAQVDGGEEERDLDGMAINVDLEYQVGEGRDCLWFRSSHRGTVCVPGWLAQLRPLCYRSKRKL